MSNFKLPLKYKYLEAIKPAKLYYEVGDEVPVVKAFEEIKTVFLKTKIEIKSELKIKTSPKKYFQESLKKLGKLTLIPQFKILKKTNEIAVYDVNKAIEFHLKSKRREKRQKFWKTVFSSLNIFKKK